MSVWVSHNFAKLMGIGLHILPHISTSHSQMLCRDVEGSGRGGGGGGGGGGAERRRRGRGFITVPMRLNIPRGCMCRPCSAGVGVKAAEIADISDKRELWGTYDTFVAT